MAARVYTTASNFEADTDLNEELLQQIPAEKRLLSWYGNVNDLTELERRFRASLVCAGGSLQTCYESEHSGGRVSAARAAQIVAT